MIHVFVCKKHMHPRASHSFRGTQNCSKTSASAFPWPGFWSSRKAWPECHAEIQIISHIRSSKPSNSQVLRLPLASSSITCDDRSAWNANFIICLIDVVHLCIFLASIAAIAVALAVTSKESIAIRTSVCDSRSGRREIPNPSCLLPASQLAIEKSHHISAWGACVCALMWYIMLGTLVQRFKRHGVMGKCPGHTFR